MYLSCCNVKVFDEWDNVTSSVSKSWPGNLRHEDAWLDDKLLWVTSHVSITHYF